MNLIVKVYNMSKYEAESVKVAETEYKNVSRYEVVEIADNQVYEMGYDETDEYGEYLILTHENGETSTFRNSHVDLFRA